MTIYNIPMGQPFLRRLAEGILTRFGAQPITMGQVVVLLPTRRGCLSLKEIFQEKAKQNALILPRIYALADLEQDPILPGLTPPITSSKVISKWQRMGHLTQLVQQFLHQKNLCQLVATAYPLAQELATLLDEFYISNVDLTQLETVVEDDFSLYWQQNLAFLKIISEYWPAILKEKNLIEAAQFQQQNMAFITQNWHPPFPVILAGTTGTRPATANLARAILDFPQGMVVLPGFDPDCAQDIGVTHPNYTLCQFTNYLGVGINTIEDWSGTPPILDTKTQLLKLAMRPTFLATDQLPPLPGPSPKITPISCATADEEAQVIAAILRSVYEKPQGTAALITPDQGLTRRVQAYLKRWDIEANISSGTPLTETVVGTFFALIARFNVAMPLTEWVALLKHPLFFKSEDRADHLRQVRQLEKEVLRKKRGFTVMDSPLLPDDLRPWYEKVLIPLTPLLQQKNSRLFAEWLTLHQDVATHLAGETALWANNDGEVAKQFFDELQTDTTTFPLLKAADYAALMNQLMQQVAVHRKEGIGSPLKILGTLEARQTEADVMILAGLNEGVWPQSLDEGPWLSNQMRLKLGLAPVQRRLGLAAHDFCLGFSNPEVYLTRAEQQEGTATVPSRLWLRLQTLLCQYNLTSPQASALKTAVRQLDQPLERKPALSPRPTAPLALKPTQYSVTDIERLMRDPYSVYAKNILKLKKLEPLDQPLSPREWGQLVHTALDLTFKNHHPRQGETFITAMKQIGLDVFEPYLDDVIVRTFWRHRFDQICDWIGQLEDLRNSQAFICEEKGQIDLIIGPHCLTLKTIVDRIDTLAVGKCQLIDYKTGILPTENDIHLGFAPQLALEGLILQQGGFKNLVMEDIQAVYWELKGGLDAGQIKSLKEYPTLLSQAAEGLEALLGYFHSDEAIYLSYPWGEEKVRFHDYRQLARVDEWL